MGKKIIGIDIQSSGVSAVLLNSSLRDNQIENAFFAPFSSPGEEGSVLAPALATLSSFVDFEDAVCIAAIPPEKIAYRNLLMPFKGNKKIAQVIPFELEPTLPFPVEQQIIEFHPLDLTAPEDKTEILAMTVSTSELDQVIGEMNAAQLDPLRISMNGYATVQCLSWLKPMPACWLMLHLGMDYITLFFILNSQVTVVRTFPWHHPGKKRLQHIETRIQQTLSALEDRFSTDEKPEKLVVTGPGTRRWNDKISQRLEKTLGLKVEKTDLITETDTRVKRPASLAWDSPNFDNALALALAHAEGKNGCNFRKGAYATRKDWSAQKPLLIRIGIFALILLMLLAANLMVSSMSAQKKIDRLNTQINDIFHATLPDVKRIVDPVHQLQGAMNDIRKSTFSSVDADTRPKIIDILKAVSEAIPEKTDVEITRMVADEDHILISGSTDTFNAVDDIQNKLGQISFFKKVTISSSRKDQKENRIRFKIKADL